MQNLNLTDPRRPINPMIKPKAVGAYTDAHGCRPSAGYTWCPKENRCARLWELARAMGINNSQAKRYCDQKPSQASGATQPEKGEEKSAGTNMSFFQKYAAPILISMGAIVMLLVVLFLLSRGRKQARSRPK